MIQSYYYNPFGNDGIKNPAGTRTIYKLICDFCFDKLEITLKDIVKKHAISSGIKDSQKLASNFNMPKNWLVTKPNTLMETHFCPRCKMKGH